MTEKEIKKSNNIVGGSNKTFQVPQQKQQKPQQQQKPAQQPKEKK